MRVHRILINFPTNIGDTILALPSLDLIKGSYPQAKITAIATSNTQDFLKRHYFLDEVVLYNKQWPLREKIRFCLSLKNKYQLIVDFKNSLLPIILGVKRRTPFIRRKRFFSKIHSKDRYINLVAHLLKEKRVKKGEFFLEEGEKKKWDSLELNKAIFVATSSRSSLKVYPQENLREVIASLSKKFLIVLIGEKEEKDYYQGVSLFNNIINLVGQTTIFDIYYLLKKFALLLLSVDTSILHLGSYLNVPIVALFGPTSHFQFGPWSDKSLVLFNKEIKCRPCELSTCKFNYECMRGINPQDVVKAVLELGI